MLKICIPLIAMVATALLLGCSKQENPANAQNDLKKIQDRGKLIAGVSSHLPGMSFYNPSSNNFEGFEPDIARKIAKEILGSETKIEFVAILPENRTKLLQSGKIDLAIDELSINNSSTSLFDLSESYYVAIETLLVKKDSSIANVNDLANKTVALVADTSTAENVPKLVPGVKTVIVSNHHDGLDALKYNEADALAGPYILLKILRNEIPQPENYRILEGFFASETWVVGIRQTQPQLLQEINKALQKIKEDGSWEAIYNKNLKPITGQTVLPPR